MELQTRLRIAGALLGLSLGGLLAVGATACSDDGAPGGDGGPAGDAAADRGATADGGADAPPPATDRGPGGVAPEKLLRDKQRCPAAYRDKAPAAGVNDGFEVAGQARRFALRLPSADKVSGPRPLLVWFHGTGGTGDEILSSNFAAQLLGAGFVVAAGDGADNGTVWPEWDGLRQADDRTRENRDLELFDAIVDCLAAHLEIDAKRIYVAGHSAGGIMTNRVLRERSSLLAGGVPASGIFELTEPATPAPLGEMAVMVTWGGDNDAVDSTTSGGKEVPGANFAEQAAIASQAYEQEPQVNQVYCKGDNLGHKWLAAIDDLIVEFLVAHPKGAALSSPWTLTQPGAGTRVTCGEDVASYTPAVQVTCAAQTTPGCQSYCQTIGDCVVENATVSPVFAPQLTKIGFAGADLSECAGCVTQCEQDLVAGGGADDGVLACFTAEMAAKQCGAGVSGAMPFIDTVNACCKGQPGSAVCGRLCQAILENTVAASFFPECAAFTP